MTSYLSMYLCRRALAKNIGLAKVIVRYPILDYHLGYGTICVVFSSFFTASYLGVSAGHRSSHRAGFYSHTGSLYYVSVQLARNTYCMYHFQFAFFSSSTPNKFTLFESQESIAR